MWYSLVCMSCPTVCISVLSYPPEGTVKQPVVLNLPHPPWLGLNKEHGDQKSLIRTCKPWVTEGLFPSNLKQHPNNKIKLKYWMGSLLPFFCKQLNGPVSRMDSTTGTETCGVLFFMFLGSFFFLFTHSSNLKARKRAPSSLLLQLSLGPAPTPSSQKVFLHSDFA